MRLEHQYQSYQLHPVTVMATKRGSYPVFFNYYLFIYSFIVPFNLEVAFLAEASEGDVSKLL